jgi:hypothetical protein
LQAVSNNGERLRYKGPDFTPQRSLVIMMTRKKTFRKTHTSVVLLLLRVAVALALVGVMAGSCGGSANDTIRVSVNSSEAQADIWSDHPSISSDGRFVAFESEASNLVANDTNSSRDVFVRELPDTTAP